jgi:hypothetical protein
MEDQGRLLALVAAKAAGPAVALFEAGRRSAFVSSWIERRRSSRR